MTQTAVPVISPDDDAALLREFAQTHSQAAFRQIVDRYVNMVHAAARRQVRDPHLAEDITQAVFLLLSQRAGVVSAQRAVGGWLLLTTRNVARNALKREWRLKRREQEAAKMNSEERLASSPEAATIAPMLDDALARLAEADRNAIFARFFNGGSHRDVGRQLGVTEEAATKRVSRAVGKLRAILERQGITTTEASLSALLPVIALKPAASVALVSSVVGTASAAAPPAAIAALAHGAAAGSTLSGTSIAVGAGLVAVIAAGAFLAVATLMNKPPAPPVAAAPLPANPAPVAPPARRAIAAAPAPAGRTVTLSMVDAKTAAPIPDVQVQLELENGPQTTARADANGKYVLNLPATFQYARAFCSAPGHAAMSIDFPNYTFKGQLLADYTVPMEAGTKIGGIVVDESGEPIIGATVSLSSYIRGPMDQPRPILRGENVQTGVDGRWSFDNAPSDTSLINIEISHPDYPKNQPYSDAPKDALLRGDYKRELKWQVGRSLDGVVFDPDGKPLAGVTLVVASDRYESSKPKATSDAAGKFHLTGITDRYRTFVTATAPGFAPQQVELTAAGPDTKPTDPLKPIEVHLEKGVMLEGAVVDAAGKPLIGAKVEVDKWRGNRALVWSTKTDRQGHFAWPNAPTDPMEFIASKKNFAALQGAEVKAGNGPVTLTLHPPLHITGNVIDAETKQPIPAFRVVYGIRWTGQDDVIWQSQDARSISNGKYEAHITNFSNGGRLRVEADGYLPEQSRLIEAGEGTISIDFELKRGNGPSGTVVDAGGKPVPNLRVVGIPDNAGIYIDWTNGSLDDQERLAVTRTDKDGHYRLRAMETHYSLLAVGDGGFVALKQDDVPRDGTLKLLQWARFEGDLRLNAGPLVNATIAAQTTSLNGMNCSAMPGQATTDAAGHFVIDRVVPGQPIMLYQLVPMGGGSSRYRVIGRYSSVAGQTIKVRAGGVGRPVIAKLLPPPGMKDPVNWPQQLSIEPVVSSYT
ncbi:MAG TPA: sigma-70 family RNA polymerase sigma factor, partial [Tepidisphaeraceae bacterium]|nr:sigma-70 family RNA polymerase sigma factor [Tepidisphaeraceae bacterium]